MNMYTQTGVSMKMLGNWEAFVDSCTLSPDIRSFGRALQFAKSALQEDLAPFQIEWILDSLLHSPVNLITQVERNYLDETWTQPISEAFKLLKEVAEKHKDIIETYFESIVAICNLPLSGNACKNALQLLKEISTASSLPSAHLRRHLARISERAAATTDRVALIGAICKHNPESAIDLVNEIWRTLLILLDSNKNTALLDETILRAIHDLFIHFGTSLPIGECFAFYDTMVAKHLQTKCQRAILHPDLAVCLQILSVHYELFAERYARDSGTRAHLWDLLNSPNSGMDAVTAVRHAYSAVCKADRSRIETILINEVLPLTFSNKTRVKYTALRILSQCSKQCPARVRIDSECIGNVPNELTLEFEMRNGTVSYDIAEAVSWCLEANTSNAANILQTAILFKHHFPDTRGNEIVKQAMLNADAELRYKAVTFLTNESIQSDGICMERHFHTWQTLLDNANGEDSLVVEKSGDVFRDFVTYSRLILDVFLEENLQSLPRRVTNLLKLTLHVLSLQTRDDQVSGLVSMLTPLLLDIAREYESADAVRTLNTARSLLDDHTLMGFDSIMNLNGCKDEPTLCAMCEAVIDSPSVIETNSNVRNDQTKRYIHNTVSACRIVFGRDDVQPNTMSKALRKLEEIIYTYGIEDEDFHQISNLLERQRTINPTSKESRVFHKDVTMFMARHGCHKRIHDARNVMCPVKEDLCLHLPDVRDGANHKINLSEILDAAVQSEDPSVLMTMLTVIYANLQATPELSLLALPRTILALCRSYSRCADQSVNCQIMTHLSNVLIDSVECVAQIIQYITVEQSPGVRGILSDMLEKALLEDQSGDLVVTAAQSIVAMLEDGLFKKAGLDMADTILSAIQENRHNSITETCLPQILDLISKTYDTNSESTFELGAKVYMEKIELFDDNDIQKLLRSLMTGLVKKNDQADMEQDEKTIKSYKKTVKVVLDFVKKVFDYKKDGSNKLFDVFFGIYDSQEYNFEKILYVLSDIHTVFGLEIDMSRKILSHKQYAIQSELFCMDLTCEYNQTFRMEAMLKFVTEFAEILLELQYQKTLDFLGKIIVTMTPECVISLHRTVKSCLTAYKNILKSYPKTLVSKLEEWCQQLNLGEITKSINKDLFEETHEIAVKSLKRMLSAYQLTDVSTLTDVKRHCQSWPLIVLKLFSKGHIEGYYMSKLPYITDVMTVGVQFVTLTDVKSLVLEGCEVSNVPNEMVGVRFCAYFVSAFCARLCQKPYLLLEDGMSCCVSLLYDIVKHVCWKQSTDTEKENLMDLVHQLWPTYTARTSFSQQCELLASLNTAAWPAWTEAAGPAAWARAVMADAAPERTAKVIASVKGGAAFSESYKTVASSLPTRLSEFKGTNQAILRAMIDALSSTADDTLLNIVCCLAGGDQTKGWWDTALDACMASLQTLQDINVLYKVYSHCFSGTNLGVVERIMVHLLRYSTPSQCEEFFKSKVNDLCKKLKPLTNKTDKQREMILADCTRTFIMLQVAFEKLPLHSLESPSSAINEAVGASRPWNLVIKVCKEGNSLRDTCKDYKETPSEETKSIFRRFHCANYNCVAAAVCRWRPRRPRIYHQFHSPAMLDLLVDNAHCHLPLHTSRSRPTRRRPVSIELPLTSRGVDATSRGVDATSRSVDASFVSLTSQPMRTRLFLRTLSENPLQFDLIAYDQQLQPQDIDLTENILNAHECAATLTALFRTCDCFADLTDLVASALITGSLNVKLLVAQTICNSSEELSPHAISLRAALLHFVANTPVECNGKCTLHQLHVDVMETLIQWPDNNVSPCTELDKVLSLLLTTCMENKQKPGVFNTLVSLLTRWLDLYGGVSQIEWNTFLPYLNDKTEKAKSALLKLLSRICKAKRIVIPQLVPTLMKKLQNREDLNQTSKLFGLAVNCQNDPASDLSKFRSLLYELKSRSPVEYVKVLYNAQMGCVKVCDEKHFRLTVDQVFKQVGEERTKCFKILSSYVTHSPHSQCVTEMYETLSLCDVIAGDNVTDVTHAIRLVAAGYQSIGAQVKRRIVNVITERCTHNNPAVSEAASEVVLMDFKDVLTSTKCTEPPTKRQKTDPFTSPLLHLIQTHDVEYAPIVRVLSVAVATNRIQAADLLSTDLRFRLKECYALTVELPMSHTTDVHNLDLSVCTSTFIQLLFSDLRSQEHFRNVRLREHGLEISETQSRSLTQPLKLLSGTRTYQGTFSKPVNTKAIRNKLSNANLTNVMTQNTTGIDVTIPIDDVLGKIIEFAQKSTWAACALVVALAHDLNVPALGAACLPACPMTPLALRLVTCHPDNTARHRLMESLERLKETTKRSEAERLVKYVYRNVEIDILGEDQFVLGREIKCETDIDMKTDEFSLEGLGEAFGELSDWDQLTSQAKRRVLDRGLPPLWTDKDAFTSAVQGFQVADNKGWFGKMAAAYRRLHKRDTLKWLREMDLWPRRYFHVSAIAEAIEWQWSANVNTMNTPDIQDGDCLAEWAARLMIRKAFIDSVTITDNEEIASNHAMLSRSHELQWCERATEIGLGVLALDCVKRNVVDMYRSETLSWLNIQAAGLRAKGLQTDDLGVLRAALQVAESNLPEYGKYSTSGVVVAAHKLILQLHCDLNSLTRWKLQECLQQSIATYQRDLSQRNDPKTQRDMADICLMAMGHYCDMWDQNEESQETILQDMTEVASKVSNVNSRLTCQFVDVILSKLDGVKDMLTDEVAVSALNLVHMNMEKLDDFSIKHLRCHSSLFPSHLLASHPYMSEREDDIVIKYKQCFQLLSDAEFTLMCYCEMLLKSLRNGDKIEWTKTFRRMKEILFENNYAGSDYLLLNKYKESLYEIEHNCDNPTTSETLQTIKRTLSSRKSSTVLKLSQLCPALASGVDRDSDIITKLLGIKGTKVIGFDEQLQVYTDSIRRPVIIGARSADGRRRRYLVKLGDDLRGDAAAMKVAASIAGCITTYQVTPISEDCGLIEYLENYQRLRALVSQRCDLTVTDQVRNSRPPDGELILSRRRVLSLHASLTATVPPTALRCAIDTAQIEIEDSLAHMVVFGWIMGLGDRHLENILYSIKDGRFCCVDWAAILQYGVGEIPPARLTRNIVAACDTQLLESRMQSALSRLRQSRRVLLPTIEVAFRGLGARFHDKLPYIKSILEGESTSYHVTKDAIMNSKLKHKEQYIELLDEVFDDLSEINTSYSVEDQVLCATLSHTRPPGPKLG